MSSTTDIIHILDFGSQYTQLIARRVRELDTYCEIRPYNTDLSNLQDAKGIILSGSPCSVNGEERLDVDIKHLSTIAPILGVCYGAQYIADVYGGKVSKSEKREYGKAMVSVDETHVLFTEVEQESQMWMSLQPIGKTANIPYAAFSYDREEHPIFGIQFHPEVTHSLEGSKVLKNFIVRVCGVKQGWSSDSFVDQAVQEIKSKVGDDQVLLGISGGVDSTVAAMLIHKAIGDQLTSFFINNGLLRKGEFEEVLTSYNELGLNVNGIDASSDFLTALDGVADPERKRKIIGKTFIDVRSIQM